MEFVNTILFGAGFDIFNVSVVGCAIVAAVCIICAILAAVIRCQVVYVDTEGDYEIEYEKKPWLSKAVVRPAIKEGRVFIGWSLDPEGENIISEPEFLLTHTVVLYAVWADEDEIAEAKKKAEGVFVQLNYLDAECENIIKANTTKINAILPENQDVPVKASGWSFEKGGEIVLEGDEVSAVFAINLYPIFDENAKPSNEEFNETAVVELLFLDSNTDKFIYKESHYVNLCAPDTYAGNQSFVGWGVEPNGEAIIERGDTDSVFTIQLYSAIENNEEIADEVAPAVEDETEAPVEATEVYIQEEIIEEPMPKATEETVAEDVAVEETVVEEAAVEDVAVEEAVVEDVADEVAPIVEDDAPVEETVVEEVGEVVPTIIPTYFDNEGNKIEIKYSRSFTANLIQSDETVKDYYSQLKNHILSYKGTKSKISWKFDSYNRGRDQLFKIKLRGKTVCVYCALNPEEFDKSKYHHDAIDAKIFAEVPMLLKIKSGLGLRKAKEIVDIVMAKFGIEPDPKAKKVDYVAEYPYAETEDLLARKLVKALEADSSVIVKSSKAKDDEE